MPFSDDLSMTGYEGDWSFIPADRAGTTDLPARLRRNHRG